MMKLMKPEDDVRERTVKRFLLFPLILLNSDGEHEKRWLELASILQHRVKYERYSIGLLGSLHFIGYQYEWEDVAWVA